RAGVQHRERVEPPVAEHREPNRVPHELRSWGRDEHGENDAADDERAPVRRAPAGELRDDRDREPRAADRRAAVDALAKRTVGATAKPAATTGRPGRALPGKAGLHPHEVRPGDEP